MPSPVDRKGMRQTLEQGARAGAVVALLLAIALQWRGVTADGGNAAPSVQTVPANAAALDTVVLRHVLQANNGGIATDARADSLRLALTRVPGDSARGLLGGLAQAGFPVTWQWSTDSVNDDARDAMTLAATVSRTSGPNATLLVRSTSRRGAVLRDAGGLLDSVTASSPMSMPMSWQLQSASWPLTLASATSTVHLIHPDSTRRRVVRVLGAPGWEYKFTVAALEELGWQVDGSVRVAPTAQVTLGAAGVPLDTLRHQLVVVTDSVAVDAAALRRFVHAGGGMVLLGDALRIPALADVRPAMAISRRGGIAGALLTDVPQDGLDAWELTPHREAIVLERLTGSAGEADTQAHTQAHAHAEPVVVARRIGAGRVLAVAYLGMWRWRMEGRDDGIDAHRAWWARTLAAAGPVGASSVSADARDLRPGTGAPFADWVSWVGPMASGTGQDEVLPARSPWSPLLLAPWLGALALGLLCFEWGSRRLRGAR